MFDEMSVLNFANDIGLIDQFRSSLTRQYDPAAEKLDEVLDELHKMVSSLDEEIVRFLSLYFDDGESVAKGRAVLLEMEVGRSRIRINEARGHCHKIANIYDKYLRRWFQDTLQSTEADQLRMLFEQLAYADSNMLLASESVTGWLMDESSAILDLIENNDLMSANQKIRQARLDVKPSRLKFTDAMNILRGIQADLVTTTGTI